MSSVNAGILSAIIFALVGTFNLGAYFTGEGIKVAAYAANVVSASPLISAVNLPNYSESNSGNSKANLTLEDGSDVRADQSSSIDRCSLLNGYYCENSKCCYQSADRVGTTYFCEGLKIAD